MCVFCLCHWTLVGLMAKAEFLPGRACRGEDGWKLEVGIRKAEVYPEERSEDGFTRLRDEDGADTSEATDEVKTGVWCV